MFGRTKPAVFQPVSYTRQRRVLVPRSLIILLLGMAVGAGGLWYVLERQMPVRLTAEESQRLLDRVADSERERDRLRNEVQQANDRMQQAQAQAVRGTEELGGARRTIDRLQKELAQLVDALPPDPRAQTIGIRSANFAPTVGKLGYKVVFTRDRKASDPFRGALQLAVAGYRSRGRQETLVLPAVPLTIDTWEALQGSALLPEGFAPRQVTIRVLDGPAGKVVSVRVYNVS